MAPSPAIQNPKNPRREWRYTYEALSHIPTLRLFLFHPELDPSATFHGLSTDLRLDRSLLLVRWSQGGGGGGPPVETVLRVPVPRVLIDASAPVECVARRDHIEVRLALVVPVDHEIAVSFRDALAMEGGGSDGEVDRRPMPLSLDSDLKSMSGEEVHFFCNTCSARLTRRCLRTFIEMPSAHWRDVADNWFGACCCSFGGASEKLVTKYVNSYACASGTCLLDVASIVVFKDDLECYSGGEDGNRNVYTTKLHLSGSRDQRDTVEECVACDGEILCTEHFSVRTDAENEVSAFLKHRQASLTEDAEEKAVGSNDDGSSSVTPFRAAVCNDNAKEPTCLLNLDYKGISYSDRNTRKRECLLDSMAGASPCSSSRNLVKPFYDCHCSISPADSLISHGISEKHVTDLKVQMTESFIYQNVPNNGPLSNGFLFRSSDLSKEIKWVEFLCRDCSSLLGSYPSAYDRDAPVDGGIRLFKCSVSTSISAGGPQDKFRRHTLQKVFTNLLLESAVDELSYRTIVRDLNSKSPILKLVLLNSSVWCSTGHCFENDSVKATFAIVLQPFAKVLYSDYSAASEDNLRILEEWIIQSHADEVYMLPSQIQKLMEVLNSGQVILPPSCSSLQGMSLSFIGR